MSSVNNKRKRDNSKRVGAKKGKDKDEVVDLDSDLTDSSNDGQPDEVLIAAHDIMDDAAAPLPEPLLKTIIKPAGQMLVFGLLDFDATGRRNSKGQPIQPDLILTSPHRFFSDLKIRLAASGCVSPHMVLVTEEGKAMAFGRNEHGQLGLNNTTTIIKPTLVPTLQDFNIIGAACGRNHTLFLTDTGTVYSCGDNRFGQCGVGNTNARLLTPARINYRGPPVIKVGCGDNFSVILDIRGGLHTFGMPEHGQLGHNSDGKYLETKQRVCFNFETSPKRIVLYMEKSKERHVSPVDVTEIVDFACGQNHTVAIDSKKRAFSWGFGGYGRLGHNEPKDEMVPRLIKYFDTQQRSVIATVCGSTFTLAISDLGGLFMMGQNKRTGEANMYPKPVPDLTGWDIHLMTCGQTSILVSADDTVIAWGPPPTFGELGFGEFQKSSASPKEVVKLKGVKIHSMAMGMSHSIVIASTETPEQQQKYESFPEYEHEH